MAPPPNPPPPWKNQRIRGARIAWAPKNDYPTEKAKNCEIGRILMQNCNILG